MNIDRAIKRHPGTGIRVGGIPTGFLAGAGWSGCTVKLDDLVVCAGRLLARHFKCHIEVRFNTDRQRGGAWLADRLEGPHANGQVGISAGYVDRPPRGMSSEAWWALPREKRATQRRRAFFISSSAREFVLRNPSLAKEGPEGSRYSRRNHATLAAALKWIERHVDPSKIKALKRLRPDASAAKEMSA